MGIRFRSWGLRLWVMDLWATSYEYLLQYECLRELSTKCGDLRTNFGKSMESEKMKVFKIRKMPAINSI